MRYSTVKHAVASLPGYASVAAAAEVLHLAPRSVRDLIYAGRLPSLRVGRRHYVRKADLELERRRRLGLRLPPIPARVRPHRVHHHADAPRPRRSGEAARRRERAAERAAIVDRWLERHLGAHPSVPFAPAVADEAFACGVCARQLRTGARYVRAEDDGERLCLTCGRRALNDWADRRRLEAAAARRLAQELGATSVSPPGVDAA